MGEWINQGKIIFLKALIFPKKKKITTTLRHNLSFKLFFQLTISLKFPFLAVSVFKINQEKKINHVCWHTFLMGVSLPLFTYSCTMKLATFCLENCKAKMAGWYILLYIWNENDQSKSQEIIMSPKCTPKK